MNQKKIIQKIQTKQSTLDHFAQEVEYDSDYGHLVEHLVEEK